MFARMTVMIPAVTIDNDEIAPSVSPICIALEVPIAWDALPIATPFAILSSIWKIFNTLTQIMLPKTPVNMIAATAIDT